MAEQNQALAATIAKERARLKSFIRKRVADAGDAEDILQDVFSELVEAYRLPEPIEQVGAWLYRVARNRIVDLFRKRREEPLSAILADGDHVDESEFVLGNILPSTQAGPEAAYTRARLLEALQIALGELPATQREVFIAHELEGKDFKELAAATGLPVNTLLSRKRYAVLYLRSRLQAFYDAFDVED